MASFFCVVVCLLGDAGLSAYIQLVKENVELMRTLLLTVIAFIMITTINVFDSPNPSGAEAEMLREN